jgi:hypothetical protein
MIPFDNLGTQIVAIQMAHRQAIAVPITTAVIPASMVVEEMTETAVMTAIAIVIVIVVIVIVTMVVIAMGRDEMIVTETETETVIEIAEIVATAVVVIVTETVIETEIVTETDIATRIGIATRRRRPRSSEELHRRRHPQQPTTMPHRPLLRRCQQAVHPMASPSGMLLLRSNEWLITSSTNNNSSKLLRLRNQLRHHTASPSQLSWKRRA